MRKLLLFAAGGVVGFSAALAIWALHTCAQVSPEPVEAEDGLAVESDARSEFLELLRGEIKSAKDDPEYLIGKSTTTEEHNVKKEMIYLDDTYLSYRVDEYWYMGGAHGNTKILVGTLDRKTGRVLTLADVFADLPALEKRLLAAVVAKIGGKEKLQGDVKPVENFYLAEDGWHFIYNEYEVACYAEGPVEVVLPREMGRL